MNNVKPFICDQAESSILCLWRLGRNTKEIADLLLLPESAIANCLPALLEQSRAVRQSVLA